MRLAIRSEITDPLSKCNRIRKSNTLAYDRADRLLTLHNRQVGGAAKTNSAFTYTYSEVSQRTQVAAAFRSK